MLECRSALVAGRDADPIDCRTDLRRAASVGPGGVPELALFVESPAPQCSGPQSARMERAGRDCCPVGRSTDSDRHRDGATDSSHADLSVLVDTPTPQTAGP